MVKSSPLAIACLPAMKLVAKFPGTLLEAFELLIIHESTRQSINHIPSN